ncbi:MAG: cupin domain-containing protein [Frankiaceae bacterium]|nr:cupin domain-containing protein [Frankiaceae bacterium]MBV9871853.1 cupin domain-containing protein [Frankiaceae bacterium]
MAESPTRPEVGLELVNPVAGTRTVFIATAESTDGAYVEIEVTYPPNSPPPPRHLHPSQDEHFTVLAGVMHATVGDADRALGVGDELRVAAGTPHLMGAGADGAVMRWRTTPALRTGEMFCALWEVARDNDWQPNVAQLFEVVSGFGEEFCLC